MTISWSKGRKSIFKMLTTNGVKVVSQLAGVGELVG
jgi:hypothetical protein